MAYQARRAPNVSAYLANLNAIPSTPDLAGQADFALADDGLDFLTNAEFFDFDGGFDDVSAFPTETPIPEVPLLQKGRAGVSVKAPQYQFSEFQTYPPLSTNTSTPANLFAPAINLQGAYPPQQQPLQLPATSTETRPLSTTDPTTSITSPSLDILHQEEGSRFAAEEDKRRRNTAASARFRVKKKQREMALEKSAKAMMDKVAGLEGKVRKLEMENLWLRGLVVEKGKGKGGLLEGREGDEWSTEGRTDGVGTALEEALEGEA
ncbi:hypothetical protein LTR91_008137 [Friedmanniomyces endolithicus]|uniref:BZIP domain-containing protein n=1 Tax=Friedmanniomyces endolithicus TaxID=329885 RepID=A0AAN6KPK5_9PEZI|nr:hypothetical protein LTR75_003349 [Friedmanniomyces endolithicus]KAK0858613.1 hypothetical protein LTR03_000038 [Friedmanniomyces endolithicus]KAK0863911.1 hypothetical protein LTS02_006302 [Friedmanniomyces endolithicus]KAK0885889.1 hypothetical protein LTR87_000593 [Friedmanniomyces endolithicus]KAK0924836.1 hypothetical protein LTR57_005457 [Friedmanniomyces endolithicus]